MTHTKISLDNISYFGTNLSRPECVLATSGGSVYASDSRGGISHIDAVGNHRLYGGSTLDLDGPLLPNGFALDRDGSFLVCHLSDTASGLFRLKRNGQLAPMLREVDGCQLGITNFALLDSQQRVWISISTQHRPRSKAYSPKERDGSIVLLDKNGARTVATGIGFTNEIRLDAEEKWLYVNETYSRCLTRFRLADNGELQNRECITEFGVGEFPDGLSMDIEGDLWVTSIVSNRLIHVDKKGEKTIIITDSDPNNNAEIDRMYLDDKLLAKHIFAIKSKKLKNISSLAFGGPDLRTAYLGALSTDRLFTLQMPVAGLAPIHWNWE